MLLFLLPPLRPAIFTRMRGWNNPFPIVLSIGNLVRKGSGASEVGGRRYSRLPSHRGAIAHTRGVCGSGIYTSISSLETTRSPNSLLLTARVLYSPPTIPIKTPGALIVIREHIGGYDLHREGQRRPHQSLFQWTNLSANERHGTIGHILFGVYFIS